MKHDYLWRVLRAYGMPEHFIDIVKSLYRSAWTPVMVNGELSVGFQVVRDGFKHLKSELDVCIFCITTLQEQMCTGHQLFGFITPHDLMFYFPLLKIIS